MKFWQYLKVVSGVGLLAVLTALGVVGSETEGSASVSTSTQENSSKDAAFKNLK